MVHLSVRIPEGLKARIMAQGGTERLRAVLEANYTEDTQP